MNFIENIFGRLRDAGSRPILGEMRDGRIAATSGSDLFAHVQAARAFLQGQGIKKGNRCVLVAHNSTRWAALDLAMLAEGIMSVPLYARQTPGDLVRMMQDCSPSIICCGDESLRLGVVNAWPSAPPQHLFEDIFAEPSKEDTVAIAPAKLAGDDPITIIYTSGTSGEPKGVVLNVGNLDYMLNRTNARLDLLMGRRGEPERIFHYLPFCFAGSWIMLLTSLSRTSVLTMSGDLSKLIDEMRLAAPHYFMNVPALLERMRIRIEEEIEKRGGLARWLYEKGKAAWSRRHDLSAPAIRRDDSSLDPLWLGLARSLVFSAIRRSLGRDLKALICGSAPLAKATQLFFTMVGLPVLQVYGLTETTAICTMDDPREVIPGRVGPAIPGTEMRLGPDDEILVRGPNIFPGYWNRPEETARVLNNGWFHTGDQGEVDGSGNWSVTGRIKDLIVLSSGHNVAPEPIEMTLSKALPSAQQVVIMGNGRSYLSAIITGEVVKSQVEAALDAMNAQLPHYKSIRAFHLHREPFSVNDGLLTANGKLKRKAIAERFREQVESLYGARKS